MLRMTRVSQFALPTIATLLSTNHNLEDLQIQLRDRQAPNRELMNQFTQALLSSNAVKLHKITVVVLDSLDRGLLTSMLRDLAKKYVVHVVERKDDPGE